MIAKVIEHNGEAVLLFPPDFPELTEGDEVELTFLSQPADEKPRIVVRKASA